MMKDFHRLPKKHNAMIRHHETLKWRLNAHCKKTNKFRKTGALIPTPNSNFRLLDELLGGSRVEESALHFEKHREMRAKWKKKRTRRLKRKRRKMRQRSK